MNRYRPTGRLMTLLGLFILSTAAQAQRLAGVVLGVTRSRC